MTRDGEWSAGSPPEGFQQNTMSGGANWPAQSGQGQQPPQTPATPQLETLLHSLVTRLEESDKRYSTALDDLHNRLDAMSAQAGSARQAGPDRTSETLNRVETQAADLARQVREADQQRRAQQAEASLRALENRLGDYASQMPPQSPPASAQRGFSDQFANITAGFEQELASGQPTAGLEEVNRKISDLSTRLESAIEDKSDAAALRAIEAQLNNLTTQFAQAQKQYARVESIESNLVHLMNEMRSSGSSIDDAAQKAAQKTAQAMGSMPESVSDRLDAVQRELNMLSERSREIDGRTVGTLETMNATLQSLSSQIIAPRENKQPKVPPMAAGEPAPAAPDRTAEALAASTPPPAPPSSPPAQTMGAEPHVEPQITKNTVGAAIPDFQEPPLTRDASMGPDAIVVEDDGFLASARRAANAAAASKDMPEPEKSGFLGKFKRKPSGGEKALATSSKGPRPVLVLAAILLLGSGAAFLYGKLKNDNPGPGAVTPLHSEPVVPKRGDSPVGTGPQTGLVQPQKDTSKLLPGTLIPGREAQRFPGPGSAETGTLPKTAHRTSGTGSLTTGAPKLVSAPKLPIDPEYPGLAVTITEPGEKTSRTVTPLVPAARPAATPALPAKKISLRPAPKTQATVSQKPRTPSLRSPMPPAALGPQSLRLAAARGNPQAQTEIALRYAKGSGVERNYKRAAEWYERAAGQGFAPAQYHLAALYERGRGVKKDANLAKVWYERAAKLGNIKAMHNLAVMHTGTDGGKADYKTAAYWFSQASRHGLPDSQFNLGILYESGLGVAKNPLEAYQWLTLAAVRGDKEAEKRRQQVKLLLPPETVKSADRAVSLWRARPKDIEANEIRAPRGGWRNAEASAKPNNSGDKKIVTDVQKLLNILGYDAGVPDGVMGAKTREAIKRFEKRSGYKTSGQATPELVERLKALIS